MRLTGTAIEPMDRNRLHLPLPAQLSQLIAKSIVVLPASSASTNHCGLRPRRTR